MAGRLEFVENNLATHEEGIRLGLGVGGEELGDKPLAKQGAKLIAIEHSPSILCLLCTSKSIRVRIIGKDVTGDWDNDIASSS